MTATFSRSAAELPAATSADAAANSNSDALDLARRRMRHLAPWNVRVLPVMHAAKNALPTEPLSEEARGRYRRLAICMLALHMNEATFSRERFA